MTAFIAFLKQYALKASVGLAGWQQALLSFIADALIGVIKKLGIKYEQDKRADEALEKYKDKIADPAISDEERRRADRDFLS